MTRDARAGVTPEGMPGPTTAATPNASVAVVIPCLDEAGTIGDVVAEFRHRLPLANIWVVDNGSSDETVPVAERAGARIIHEDRRGKGRAIRTAVERLEDEICVLADGDGQMPSERLPALLEPILAGRADMVVGSRALASGRGGRPVNAIGNVAFSWLARLATGTPVTDALSGYRAVSTRLIRGLGLTSDGFEIDMELTLRAAHAGWRVVEIPCIVRERSHATSHLRVVRDGARIVRLLLALERERLATRLRSIARTGSGRKAR